MQMRFQHMGDARGALTEQLDHSVDVALRIDDHHGVVVGYHVTAIAQARGLDDLHIHAHALQVPPDTTAWCTAVAGEPASWDRNEFSTIANMRLLPSRRARFCFIRRSP